MPTDVIEFRRADNYNISTGPNYEWDDTGKVSIKLRWVAAVTRGGAGRLGGEEPERPPS